MPSLMVSLISEPGNRFSTVNLMVVGKRECWVKSLAIKAEKGGSAWRNKYVMLYAFALQQRTF